MKNGKVKPVLSIINMLVWWLIIKRMQHGTELFDFLWHTRKFINQTNDEQDCPCVKQQSTP